MFIWRNSHYIIRKVSRRTLNRRARRERGAMWVAERRELSQEPACDAFDLRGKLSETSLQQQQGFQCSCFQ